MKPKMLFLLCVIVSIAMNSGCMKKNRMENSTTFSDEQNVTLQTMNAAYVTAKSANDSIIICGNLNHAHMIHQFDSSFHSNDSIFTFCQSKMMGNGTSGMMNGNRSCNAQNQSMLNVINKMKYLKIEHGKLHSEKIR